ncbi:DUF4981 domain-containing protein, partial [Salmonella enterica]|nr:DUF4981 domain-containing protein [Salmonella enterica]
IFCPMYASPDDCQKYAANTSNTKPLIQCEYNHTMGNSGGNLADYWDLVRRYPIFQGGFDWDFVDQGLRRKKDERGKGRAYTYGGDYNDYDPSDNNFNCNGLLGPDRQLNPHAYELAYQYQDAWATLVSHSQTGAVVSVRNERAFTSLDDVRMTWALLENGAQVAGGVIDHVNVAPQQTSDVDVNFGRAISPGVEALLNIDFQLVRDKPLMKAGQTIAYAQLPLGGQYAPAQPTAKPGKAKAEQKGAVTLTAGDAKVQIDPATGLVNLYTSGSDTYIANGATIKPNFWRAPTDNDMGAGFQTRLKAWRDTPMQLQSLTTATDRKAGTAQATATLRLTAIGATLTLTYTLDSRDGSLTIAQQLTPDPESSATDIMFRFGLALQMPKQMNLSSFYGRGPAENYT